MGPDCTCPCTCTCTFGRGGEFGRSGLPGPLLQARLANPSTASRTGVFQAAQADAGLLPNLRVPFMLYLFSVGSMLRHAVYIFVMPLCSKP